MKVLEALQAQITQAEFAQVIGVSEAKVSQLISETIIERGAPAHAWLLAYVERLRAQAAGRMGEGGGLDLPQERAALARSQRIGQDIKNAVARKEYAPIGLLADVLGAAASSVVERFDQLDGALKKASAELPEPARAAIHKVIASARNEWIRSTQALVVAKLDELVEEDDQAAVDVDQDGGGA